MSTNARSGVDKGGQIRTIYCHWDGYLSYVGRILESNYKTEDEVEKLINMGDMSSIGEEIGQQVDFDKMCSNMKYIEEHKGQCVFYHRDRGEDLEITEMSEDELAHCEEYNYLFRKGKWYVSCDQTDYHFVPIDEVEDD